MLDKNVEDFSGDYLSWLNSFYVVAQQKSFSRAAEIVGRSQSTITYQIKKLEKRLGVALFDRSSAPLELTSSGVKLFSISEQIFSLLYQMRGEVGSDFGISGSVKVICTYGLATYYLPAFLVEFKRRFPHVSVEILPVPLAEQIRAYHAPDVDFVIGLKEIFPEGGQSYHLMTAPMALVAPPSWEIGDGGPLRVEDFANLPFIGFWPDYPLDRRVAKCIRDMGVQLNIVQHGGYFLPILQYIALGQGVSILDQSLVEQTGMPVKTYSLEHLFAARDYVAIHPPRQYLSPAVRELLKFLQERPLTAGIMK